MKGLSLEFAANIIELMERLNIPLKHIDIYELIIMGMFIANIAYFRQTKDRGKEQQINEFHNAMDNVFVNELFLKSHNVSDNNQIETFLYMMSKNINSRYSQYDELLSEDLSVGSKMMRNTIDAFSKNIFIDVDEDEVSGFQLLAPIVLMSHLTGCIKIISQW